MTDLGVKQEELNKDMPSCCDSSSQDKNSIIYPRLWVSDVEIPGCEIGKEVTLKAVCMGVTKRERSSDENVGWSYEFDVHGADVGGDAAKSPPMKSQTTSDKMDGMFNNFDKKQSNPTPKKGKKYAPSSKS